MPAPIRITPAMTGPDGLLDPTVVLTLPEAAKLCGVHRDKVRYRLRDGRFRGAHRIPGDGAQRWGVPIGDLVKEGLLDPARVSRASGTPYAVGLAAGTRTPSDARDEVAVLREKLEQREAQIAALVALVAEGRAV